MPLPDTSGFALGRKVELLVQLSGVEGSRASVPRDRI